MFRLRKKYSIEDINMYEIKVGKRSGFYFCYKIMLQLFKGYNFKGHKIEEPNVNF